MAFLVPEHNAGLPGVGFTLHPHILSPTGTGDKKPNRFKAINYLRRVTVQLSSIKVQLLGDADVSKHGQHTQISRRVSREL